MVGTDGDWGQGPGGTGRRDCSGTHDLYRGSATVGAVGMTISMIPNHYSERGLTQRAVSGGDPATREPGASLLRRGKPGASRLRSGKPRRARRINPGNERGPPEHNTR